MQSIHIMADGRQTTVTVTGAEVRSWTVEYIRGYPVRVSCIIGDKKTTQRDKILH